METISQSLKWAMSLAPSKINGRYSLIYVPFFLHISIGICLYLLHSQIHAVCITRYQHRGFGLCSSAGKEIILSKLEFLNLVCRLPPVMKAIHDDKSSFSTGVLASSIQITLTLQTYIVLKTFFRSCVVRFSLFNRSSKQQSQTLCLWAYCRCLLLGLVSHKNLYKPVYSPRLLLTPALAQTRFWTAEREPKNAEGTVEFQISTDSFTWQRHSRLC